MGAAGSSAAIGVAGCVVPAATLMQTRHGLLRADAMAAMQSPPEVWSAGGWVRAAARPLGKANIVSVLLSDGSKLECAADASWPIVTRGTKLASELRTGDRVAPYPAVPVPELAASSSVAQAMRDLGTGAPPRRLATTIGGLSGEGVRAFVEGWANAQKGHLSGCESVIAELQVLLRRTGVNRTLIERHPQRTASLYVDDREAWPSDAQRLWTRRLRSARQTVVSVESLKRQAVFAINTEIATNIVVGNTLLSACGAASPSASALSDLLPITFVASAPPTPESLPRQAPDPDSPQITIQV